MTAYTKYKKWTNAKKTIIKGKKYDSKFEAGYSLYLDQQIKEGKIDAYETHKKIDLMVNGYHICFYYIDFLVYHNDGILEYVETKGYRTDIWKLKWSIFEALYSDMPNVKLTIVQQT